MAAKALEDVGKKRTPVLHFNLGPWSLLIALLLTHVQTVSD
jgi:hypothetical protein